MKCVLDTNVTVALVLDLPYSAAAEERIRLWLDHGVDLLVPMLWSYEVVSVLRKAVVIQQLSATEAEEALTHLLALGLKQIPPTLELHRKALWWSGELSQTAAYDAAYLAISEQEGAELWTADSRLVNATSQAGIDWVHHITEPVE